MGGNNMHLIIKRFEQLSTKELYEILQVRIAVFVVEQKCTYQDLDHKDQNSYHVFLKNDTGIQAYLRVVDKGVSFEEVSIGRVLTIKRGSGLGDKIVLEGIRVAWDKMGADKIKIEAQTYAKPFYEKLGFIQVSEEFLDEGIPHIEMVLKKP